MKPHRFATLAETLLPFSEETSPGEQRSIIQARRVVSAMLVELEKVHGRPSQLVDLSEYSIVLRGNDAVHLRHETVDDANVYGRVGYRIMLRIQEALRDTFGWILKVEDLRRTKSTSGHYRDLEIPLTVREKVTISELEKQLEVTARKKLGLSDDHIVTVRLAIRRKDGRS